MNLPHGCPFAPRCPLVIDVCHESEPPLAETDRSAHFARCHRWSDLITIDAPQSLFERQEIGVVENPAVLAAANLDLPMVEDVADVQHRLHDEHDTDEETTS
jgi:peptide/nickel transport system ATP-binding protein